MVQTANTTADKALDAMRDATAKSLPAKQALAVAPGIEKATANVSNAASDFLARLQRNMEAFTKAQQVPDTSSGHGPVRAYESTA